MVAALGGNVLQAVARAMKWTLFTSFDLPNTKRQSSVTPSLAERTFTYPRQRRA